MNRIVLIIFITTILSLHSVYTFATDKTSTGNGNWNNNNTWNPSGIPSQNDNVTIIAGHTITVNNNASCANLIIDGTLQCTNKDLSVYGTTAISSTGTLSDNSNNGINNFSGLVTINSGGSMNFTVVTTAQNLIFQNGITNNGSSFSAGGVLFNTNNQTIAGSTSYNFANSVIVTGINLTNNATVSMTNTAAGTLSGTGIWTQGSTGILNYSGSAITIASFDVSATGNTFNYNSNSSQTIFNPVSGKYYNLNISNTGTKTLSSSVDVNGNLTISDLAILSVSTFDMTIAGDWINSSTAADPFIEGTRTVTFDGTSAQNIFNTGNANGTVFNNITVNNSFPVTALTLNAATTVNGTLTLQDGHIITTATNILVLGTAATVSIGATPDSSFVKGPMIQTYNVSASSVTKIFPIGKGNIMHRADLSIRQTNTTATQYTGEFFYSSATALGYTLPGTLSKVSDIDYWNISNGGAANVSTASIQLYYFPDDGVTDTPNLRIAKSDGAGNWLDIGGNGTATPTGTITSSVNFTTAFSKFSLANAKGGSNTLPIELSSFGAKPDNGFINITWSTLSETNNDFFTVEKSKDAINFEPVVLVNGAGNSNELLQYSAKDYEPFQGILYYRLKQTDFDGTFTFSDIVPVFISNDQLFSLFIYPNPANDIININLSNIIQKGNLVIYNQYGASVFQENFSSKNELKIDVSCFSKGIYFMKISNGDKAFSGKFIVQ